MTPIAITFFIIAALIIWGGLISAIIYLIKRPEIEHWPDGDDSETDENNA